jgi:Tol biopolymer transport system component
MQVIMKRTLLFVLLILVLCGCGEAAVPEAEDTSAATPSSVVFEETPTATVEPEPTSTVVEPTSTPEPTATAVSPAPEPVDPTETAAPTATPEIAAVQSAETSTAATEETSTTELEGRFVFQVVSGGAIYAVNADGTKLTYITDGMDPSWSTDGSQIAFSRWTEPWGIYIVNADGSGERLLFSSNVSRAPVWSPDDTQIAFYFETEGLTAPRQMCMEGECRTMPGMTQTEWHVGVLDVADGYLRQPYVDRFSFSPTWSADGEWLIYDGGDAGTLPSEVRGLCKTTVEGPNNSVLTGNTNDHYPVVSPDGTRIAFMHWQHDHWEIYIMNVGGGDRHPLTSSTMYVDPRPDNVSPAWSPDGEQIVFLSDRSGEWQFYVMDADGGNQRKILEEVTETLDIQYNSAYERVISWGA